MSTSITTAVRIAGALLVFAFIAFAGRVHAADALAKGAADYKPFAVERIGIALAGAKDCRRR
jgi:hypothetical protein